MKQVSWQELQGQETESFGNQGKVLGDSQK